MIKAILFSFLFVSFPPPTSFSQEDSFRGFKKGEKVLLVAVSVQKYYDQNLGVFNEQRSLRYYEGEIEATGNPSMARNNFVRIRVIRSGLSISRMGPETPMSKSFKDDEVDEISGL